MKRHVHRAFMGGGKWLNQSKAILTIVLPNHDSRVCNWNLAWWIISTLHFMNPKVYIIWTWNLGKNDSDLRMIITKFVVHVGSRFHGGINRTAFLSEYSRKFLSYGWLSIHEFGGRGKNKAYYNVSLPHRQTWSCLIYLMCKFLLA